MAKKTQRTRSNTTISVWAERDRMHIELADARTEKTIVEWWDDDAAEAIMDGFLNPRDYHGSAVEYANDMGL